jgi:hypothetical protein
MFSKKDTKIDKIFPANLTGFFDPEKVKKNIFMHEDKFSLICASNMPKTTTFFKGFLS